MNNRAKMSILHAIPLLLFSSLVFPSGSAQPCQCRRVVCECAGPQMVHLPLNLANDVEILYLINNTIAEIPDGFFRHYKHLKEIHIRDQKKLSYLGAGAFNHLSSLEQIMITNCQQLRRVSGTLYLKADGARLTMSITDSGLKHIPKIVVDGDPRMKMIDLVLSGNHIHSIPSKHFDGLSLLMLKLTDNLIEAVEDYAFSNTTIQSLYLNYNKRLKRIPKSAFDRLIDIQTLDVSHTSLEQLPEHGLENLYWLLAKYTDTLKHLPPIESLPGLKIAELTYPYHCCLFKSQSRKKAGSNGLHRQRRAARNGKGPDLYDDNKNPIVGHIDQKIKRTTVGRFNVYTSENVLLTELNSKSYLSADNSQNPGSSESTDYSDDLYYDYNPYPGVYGYADAQEQQEVECSPSPNPLNPCENLLGNWALRVAAIIVAVFAIAGNAILIYRLLKGAGISEPQSPLCRFVDDCTRIYNSIMFNMAIADLFIGIYMVILIIVDILTSGNYFNFAVDWQTGWGCRISGFICVFGSQASVISLSILGIWSFISAPSAGSNVTVQTRGGQLRIHRSLIYGQRVMWALRIMWLLCIVIAVLPFFNISSYAATSTCLPLESAKEKITSTLIRNPENENAIPSDRIYIIAVLSFNLICFGIICTCCLLRCYTDMTQNANHRAASYGKKTALVAFTNFLCWAPTIFFGFTALAGHPLIDISTAKVLLVIFFPINSLTNPYFFMILLNSVRKHVLFWVRRNVENGTEVAYMLIQRGSLVAQTVIRRLSTLTTFGTGSMDTSNSTISSPSDADLKEADIHNGSPTSSDLSPVQIPLLGIRNKKPQEPELAHNMEASRVEMHTV